VKSQVAPLPAKASRRLSGDQAGPLSRSVNRGSRRSPVPSLRMIVSLPACWKASSLPFGDQAPAESLARPPPVNVLQHAPPAAAGEHRLDRRRDQLRLATVWIGKARIRRPPLVHGEGDPPVFAWECSLSALSADRHGHAGQRERNAGAGAIPPPTCDRHPALHPDASTRSGAAQRRRCGLAAFR
jgi:hypothetical protein